MENAIRGMLAEYYRAFSTLNLDQFLPYFQEPALILGSSWSVLAASSADLTVFFQPAVVDLRSKGYERSEWNEADLKPLGPAAAFTSGTAIRYQQGGQELARVALSYVLHQVAGYWKIAVMIIH